MKIPSIIACSACALALLAVSERASAQTASPAASAAALDFGDSKSSTITGKAWNVYNSKDYDAAIAYADKCIELYGTKAVEMQKALTTPPTEKEQVHQQWALNDVGTCYYIKGQALEAQGKKKEAATAYKYLADNLAFAQCWDPKGWFWKPADAAREKAKKLEFDSLS